MSLGFCLTWLLLGGYGSSLPQAPVFYIEEIRVLNEDVDPKLIRSAAQLEVEKSYSEGELRRALGRIRNLPIVHDCDFALKKGSERGKFILEVSVQPFKPITVGIFTPSIADALRLRSSFDLVDPGVQMGFRWLQGAELLGYGSVGIGRSYFDDEEDAARFVNVGLSHYNLFDKHIFANLNVSYMPGLLFDGEQLAALGQASIPLRSNLWLQPVASWTRSEDYLFSFASTDIGDNVDFIEEWGLGASLEFNSVDDPWLPRKGTRAGLHWSMTQADFSFESVRDYLGESRWKERGLQLSVDFAAYKPLIMESTVWIGGGIGTYAYRNDLPYGISTDTHLGSNSETDFRSNAHFLAGFSTPAWPFHQVSRRTFRLKGEVAYEVQRLSGAEFDGRLGDFNRVMATIGLSYRPVWGVIELGLFYESIQGDDNTWH
ncbi:MAG: hypothetical protein KDC71_20600 [Acidobacteria bacterium]|nr:hypothetical protein [Acidobacteriota bacterium]